MIFATCLASLALLAMAMVQTGVAMNELHPTGSSVTRGSAKYEIKELSLNGTIGGHQVQLNGTVENIMAQMKVLHPGFEVEGILNDTSDIAERAAQNKDGILCCPVPGQAWRHAHSDFIVSGIRYLQHLHGSCAVNPRSCARVSCSWSSGIYLCNDNDNWIYPDCGYISSYAADLIRTCGTHAGERFVCGQQFDSDRYNVIVREPLAGEPHC